ncbi:MAG: redoxin domain-containing protein [Acidobacteriota bacterium]
MAKTNTTTSVPKTCCEETSGQGGQSFGAAMPDISLPQVGSGDPARLHEALQGMRGAAVLFWSGKCSHCTRYDAYLNGFAARHPEIALWVVACRQDEDAEALERCVQERGLGFPLVHDADRATARRWEVRQTPRVFLLDDGARLVYRGAVDNYTYPEDPDHKPYLEAEITALLEGSPSPHRETASYGCPIESVYYDLRKPLAIGRKPRS